MKQLSYDGIVLSCSGNCPIGGLCDAVTRRLHESGEARMLGLSQILSQRSVEAELAVADSILVVEGCHLACLRNSLSGLGYSEDEYKYLDLTTLGFDRHNSPNPDDVRHAYNQALKLINEEVA